MTKTCYNPTIDECILEILDKKNRITFTTLANILTKSQLINSRTTLSKHLKFLEKQKVIEWKRDRDVREGSIKLRDIVIKQRRYKIFEIDYRCKPGVCKEWKEKNEKKIELKRKTKKFVFLLMMMSSKTIYGVWKDTFEAGDTVGIDSNGMERSARIKTLEGFSIKDLEDNRLRCSLHNFKFSDFERTEIEEIISNIQKNNEIKLRNVYNNGHIRYDFDDEILKKLLNSCGEILDEYLTKLKNYWYLTSTKPRNEELEWFLTVVGKNKATDFLTKIDDNRTKKKTLEDLFTENHKRKNLHENTIKSIIKNRKKIQPNYFTKEGMKKFEFESPNSFSTIKMWCRDIENEFEKGIKDNEKIRKPINEQKYEWIIEIIREIINPKFSRKYFKVNLKN